MKFFLPIFISLLGFRSFAATLVCHSDLSINDGLARSADDLTQPIGGSTAQTTASAVLGNYRADISMTHLDTSMPTITLLVYQNNQLVGSVPVPIGVTAARTFGYDDFSVMTSCFVRK